MGVMYFVFSALLGSALIVLNEAEHHDIPIISNNSVIDNSFNITSFIDFTSFLNIDDAEDLDASESYEYDDQIAVLDDYVDRDKVSLDNENSQVNVTSSNVQEKEDEGNDDEESDFKFLATRGRWSYAPGFVERLCRTECQTTGKPFGRLLGARCQCYCPLNAPTLGLCVTGHSCDKYCASIGYPKGGDCVYNNVCFCFCRKTDLYNAKKVHAK